MTESELDDLIKDKECEHCEFKAARNSYSKDDLIDYCFAIANEKGGKLVLGVQNSPREVVGTSALRNIEQLKHTLLQAVGLRIDIEEIDHSAGRVIVFHIPSRPIGMPLQRNGRYLMRSGESLVPMSADQLQRIFAESGPDYSQEICAAATVDDLDPEAIRIFRERWYVKTGNGAILSMSAEQMLEDVELTVGGRVTFACLVLMGTHRALGQHLANAEVIYEYRANEGQIEASQRTEYRKGFLAAHDEIWTLVNARNDVQSLQDGMFRRDIPAFNEEAVREAVLNAICHRDYRLGGSVFIKQSPKTLQIVSPGGFPAGITTDNILKRQSPRNRRLAEACGKCGLVERSGQGMDRIYNSAIREGKGKPQFTGTDEYQVSLTMRGEILDPQYIRLLELAQTHGISLEIDHLIMLDSIREGERPSEAGAPLVEHLIRIGLAERVGRGRGSRLILSRGMYRAIGEPGTYTRYHGLDRETNKQLILKHIQESNSSGANLKELRYVVPQLTEAQIRHMVYELKSEGKVTLTGWSRHARWIAAEAPVHP